MIFFCVVNALAVHQANENPFKATARPSKKAKHLNKRISKANHRIDLINFLSLACSRTVYMAFWQWNFSTVSHVNGHETRFVCERTRTSLFIALECLLKNWVSARSLLARLRVLMKNQDKRLWPLLKTESPSDFRDEESRRKKSRTSSEGFPDQ